VRPEASSKNGVTPLLLVCQNGLVSCAKAILQKPQVNPNAVTDLGLAPIHGSAENGNVEILKVEVLNGSKKITR